jgi:hypothetical protein
VRNPDLQLWPNVRIYFFCKIPQIEGLKAKLAILLDDFNCDVQSFMVLCIVVPTMTSNKSEHLLDIYPREITSHVSHGKA